jgi:hypothetical protein
MRLLGQILEIQGAHRALEANMEFRDRAFGQRDYRNAGEGHVLVEGSDVLLVATEPIERFGNDNIEPPGACIA